MSAARDLESGRTISLVDELLAEQRTLSAVDAFSARHEVDEQSTLGRIYEERIPLGRTPLPDQQLAFRVDLDACTGCKACVTACHSLNGLAAGETWRDVGLLVGSATAVAGESTAAVGIQQVVTTACHHCEEPACLAGCPVKAYEKDLVTGIVRHLDDQCIGCQYCLLKCQYDVPKYNAELGIVRKCDMCTERLAEGEAPACVQGCPNGAITIEIVDRVGVGGDVDFLSGLRDTIPDSNHTRPTTRYVSSQSSKVMRPGDSEQLFPSKAHDPLAIGLVLMQLSVGIVLFDIAISAFIGPGLSAGIMAPGFAAISVLLGLAVATAHLGRPHLAFRAILGWRTSWMSREIIVFGAYFGAVALTVLASAISIYGDSLFGLSAPTIEKARSLLPFFKTSSLVSGLVGTACSVMIYVDTRRAVWSLSRTAPKFLATMIGLGALGKSISIVLDSTGRVSSDARVAVANLLAIALLVLIVKVSHDLVFFLTERMEEVVSLARTRRLLLGPLLSRMKMRLGLSMGGVGGCTCHVRFRFPFGIRWNSISLDRVVRVVPFG